MEITAWLRGLSLTEYRQVFLDNGLDVEVLPYLTEADLEKMGVRLGHRKQMLRAIAALGEVAPPARPAPPPARPTDMAERRQLTVMFVDLVDSTGLATRIDPEDLREVIAAYHRRTAELVAGFQGFVAQYMGDGVLVYFGYPRAAEGDVERAVRAGLAIVGDTALQAGRQRPPLRVGIETGMVIVGDLMGEGEAQLRGVIGEAPNLASRLQAFAEPDSVIIGPGTRRLLGTLFELRDLGAVEVRGLAEPVSAYCVCGLARIESRFEAFRGSQPLAPLIGRDYDLKILMRWWDCGKAGEGHIILLSGEPGIGKSRLTAALLAEVSREPLIRLRYFCSPHHVDSALYPFINQLERAAGFERGDTPNTRLDKLEALLGQAGIAREDAGLIASLLSLPDGGRYPPIDLTPQRRRQRTLDVLIGQLQRLAAQRPVLMIFEDAHWADPSSIELLDQTITRIRRTPLLAVVTFRPEFTPPWTGQTQVTSLTLSRLSPENSAELVLKTAGDAMIDPAMVDEIVDHADGVPLFVEELTKAILEGGSAEASRAAGVQGAPTTVPPALFASLMARLDRLQPGKDIAQIGSAIGREFTHELLALVAAKPESELRSALEQLIGAGLIFARGMLPEATYLFKHALVQDVAYGTLLRRSRQELHARIADALERRLPETLESQPELSAYHLSRAGLVAKAVRYWLKAGERAAARSANKEAIAHLRAGIDCLANIADSPEKLRTEIDLNSAMVAVFQVTRGYGADIVVNALNHLLELCRQTGDADLLAPVLFQTWLSNHMRANYPAGGPLAAELLEVAQKSDDPVAQMGARFANGLHFFATGDLVVSHQHFAEGARIYHVYHGLGGGYSALRYAFVTGPADVAYTAWTDAMLGYPERGLAANREAAEIIIRTRHPFTVARGLVWCSFTALTCRDWTTAFKFADRAVQTANEQGFAFPGASGALARAAAQAMLEPGEAPLAEMSDSIHRYQQFGGSQLPYLLTLVAEASLRHADWDGASQALSKAHHWMAKSGERTVVAEVHRLVGDLLVMSGRGDGEAHFLRALQLARTQKARLFELRAASSLARLWRDQGRPEEARATLEPIYCWFTEGFDMPDLVDARLLLESLKPASRPIQSD
jgi:class 3 adenylate cyclase